MTSAKFTGAGRLKSSLSADFGDVDVGVDVDVDGVVVTTVVESDFSGDSFLAARAERHDT